MTRRESAAVKIPSQRVHPWNISPREAAALQKRLAGKVIAKGGVARCRLIAGADAAFTDDRSLCVAGVVLWDRIKQAVLEEHVAVEPVRFPYVPGLLSFREGPAVLKALSLLEHEPEVFLFDGHGFAHPRRFGLACHLGVLLDRPSIGCAKSVLVGSCPHPEGLRGSTSVLKHDGVRIGLALRSRSHVAPIYISVGHRVNLFSATRLVLQCCARYRLPEPTRLADRLVAEHKRKSC